MPKNIAADYDSHTKEELLAECALRGIEDVKHASPKADIVAALALDDEDGLSQPKPPLPPIKASPIPQVPKTTVAEVGLDAGAIPKDEDFTDGIFSLDGEDYALCIHTADGYGRTHSLKNSVHTWQGTEVEFNATFKRA